MNAGLASPSVHQCRILEFSRIRDPRGVLTPIESCRDVPFEIQRVYYFYELEIDASRAGHAHKELQQALIAVSGSFDVHLDDGHERRTVTLNKPYQGLYVPRMIWRDIDNFTPRSVCVALASLPYDETDYYREYDEFLHAAGY